MHINIYIHIIYTHVPMNTCIYIYIFAIYIYAYVHISTYYMYIYMYIFGSFIETSPPKLCSEVAGGVLLKRRVEKKRRRETGDDLIQLQLVGGFNPFEKY